MVTNLNEIKVMMNAFEAMEVRSISYKALRGINKIKSTLQAEIEQGGKAQLALIEELGGKVEDSGAVTFNSVEDKIIYLKRWDAMVDEEIDVEIEKTTVPEDAVTFSAIVDTDVLEKLIDFV